MGIEESGPRLEQDWRTVGPEAPTRLLPPVLDLMSLSLTREVQDHRPTPDTHYCVEKV